MVKPRSPRPTLQCVDTYCELYRDLFIDPHSAAPQMKHGRNMDNEHQHLLKVANYPEWVVRKLGQ